MSYNRIFFTLVYSSVPVCSVCYLYGPHMLPVCTRVVLGGVYKTPGRLSPWSEFTPVPSHGSIFVYMIPLQNVMPARVTPA